MSFLSMPIAVLRRSRVMIGTAALLVAATSAACAGETIQVNVDQAKLMHLNGRVATLVIGNPMIADVALQPGGIVVVTGKGYGATNVIAMDRAGNVIEDRIVQVEGPTDDVVTVYRGVDRESYSCKPVCQRRVTLGDAETYFKATADQTSNMNSHAGTSGKAN